MARILALSSQVARGSVGLSVIVPALQALGHDVIALPSVVLSNHPGHPHVAGTRVAPDVLGRMFEALEANGWLGGVDGVLTGYLPSAEHVALAAKVVREVRRLRGGAGLTYLCDPVLGDDPKGLYIEAAAAHAVRDQLVPLADAATPNRFELSFLTGHDIRSAADVGRHQPACGLTVATSIPSTHAGETLNALSRGSEIFVTRVPLRPHAPNGTGDLFSALLLAALLLPSDGLEGGPQHALAQATAGVDAILEASAGLDELYLPALPALRRLTQAWPVEQI